MRKFKIETLSRAEKSVAPRVKEVNFDPTLANKRDESESVAKNYVFHTVPRTLDPFSPSFLANRNTLL